MERVELTDGHVEIRQAADAAGIGYELTFDVATGSPMAAELERHFKAGELLPMPHAGKDLSVSLRTMVDQGERRIYEGSAGFLRPGMGGAGG